MCGIAGIVGLPEGSAGGHAVRQMIAALVRRGPDGQGIAELPGAVLGHRRLAIFDLSATGAQPMASPDGALWVVFNGAIYNFKALRTELEKLGCRFCGASDTEVLLHGYRAWGMERLVSRLRGMFAFGLWDEAARKLFLVRDRLGVKPLVYAVDGTAIAFASTVRALERGGYGGAIDEEALADVLRWGFVSEAHCIYRGVRKLPPATILEWDAGKLRQHRYWQTPEPASAPKLSFGDAIAELEERLREAVAIRLEADVPVAVLLSGGIDSSLICWATAELGADLTAYTIGVPGDRRDETEAAAATARRLGIGHRVLDLVPEEIPEIDELWAACDEPFASSSALGMLRISRAIGPSAKVVLTGDGGDDLFLGYPRHRHLWMAAKLARHLPPALKRYWPSWRQRGLDGGPLRRAFALMDYAAGGIGAYLANSGLARYRDQGLLGPRFTESAVPIDNFSTGHNAMLEALLEFERRTRFVGEYLKKVDSTTMHYGIEARSPFLDQELWQFGAALPVDLRLRRGELKALLRALARRRVGLRVAARRKRGFTVPAGHWLARHWLGQAEQALQDSILAREGWIDGRKALAQLRRAASAGTAAEELWNIFALESWLQHERRERFGHAPAAHRQAAEAAVQGLPC